MRLDRSGIPFIAGAMLPAIAGVVARRPGFALPFGVLAAFFAYFFRDPERVSPVGRDLVLAPADGRILVAGPAEAADAPAGEWLQVSIFLSPIDVHINRTPVGGTVTHVEYRPGRFLPAYDAHAAEENERTEIWLDHEGTLVVCRQVVGVLARRIVCRVSEGDVLEPGDRIGLMKFGSRMDVFLPTDASLMVAPGDTVRGGETVVATLGA
jgi:phosphatidylserine decarboxylase